MATGCTNRGEGSCTNGGGRSCAVVEEAAPMVEEVAPILEEAVPMGVGGSCINGGRRKLRRLG